MSYGDFEFGLVLASADDADKRTDARAVCPVVCWQNSRGKLVRPVLATRLLLLGMRYADVNDARGVALAGCDGIWPCRVTAQGSRMDWLDLAGRAAGSNVGISR